MMVSNNFSVIMTGPANTGKSKLIEEIKAKCSDSFTFTESNLEHTMIACISNKEPSKPTRLRVWHVPQVPMKSFHVEADSLEKAVAIQDVLANYDLFQYENNVKGDYCNANGIQMWDESLTDEELVEMELEDRWVDWHHEEGDEYFEEPKEYLEYLAKKA